MTVSGTTIAERVVELKRKSAGRLPADLAAAFEAEIDRLVVAGVPTDAAMVGSVMPDGDLLDPVGAPTSLTAVRAGRTAWWSSTAARGARTATLRCAPTRTPSWASSPTGG